jgi:ferredoxin
MTAFRVVVDVDRCETNAVCVQTAPDVFAIGAADVAVVHHLSQDEPTHALAREAAERCPTGALRLEPIDS